MAGMEVLVQEPVGNGGVWYGIIKAVNKIEFIVYSSNISFFIRVSIGPILRFGKTRGLVMVDVC